MTSIFAALIFVLLLIAVLSFGSSERDRRRRRRYDDHDDSGYDYDDYYDDYYDDDYDDDYDHDYDRNHRRGGYRHNSRRGSQRGPSRRRRGGWGQQNRRREEEEYRVNRNLWLGVAFLIAFGFLAFQYFKAEEAEKNEIGPYNREVNSRPSEPESYNNYRPTSEAGLNANRYAGVEETQNRTGNEGAKESGSATDQAPPQEDDEATFVSNSVETKTVHTNVELLYTNQIGAYGGIEGARKKKAKFLEYNPLIITLERNPGKYFVVVGSHSSRKEASAAGKGIDCDKVVTKLKDQRYEVIE
jgi:hypothetical protein